MLITVSFYVDTMEVPTGNQVVQNAYLNKRWPDVLPAADIVGGENQWTVSLAKSTGSRSS